MGTVVIRGNSVTPMETLEASRPPLLIKSRRTVLRWMCVSLLISFRDHAGWSETYGWDRMAIQRIFEVEKKAKNEAS